MSSLRRLPVVTALGGGHGLSASLAALRRLTDRLTAVVTVADDGGSSGRIRAEFGGLPPGDLRMALAALCGDDHAGRTWAQILQTRFPGDGPLGGHAIGNLLIVGAWQQLGNPVEGLSMVGDLLNSRGRVLPMSTVPLGIEAEVLGLDPVSPDEVCTLAGQATIAKTRGQVQHVRLVPPDAPACPESVQAIGESDFVVLGPGSWFTSVMPHLLVPELYEAITTTAARRILTLNLRPADETAGYTASRHLELLADHAPELRLDHVVVDQSSTANDRHLRPFAESFGAELVVADVAMRDGSPRHDPLRLATVFQEIMER